MTMATPPRRGIGLPWILREERAWSSTPMRWASRLTSGVRIVPQNIDRMKATAAVLMLRKGFRERGEVGGELLRGRPGQYPVAEREHVHAGAKIAAERLAGRGHDRLVLVEAGVEHQRDAGLPIELGDERVVAGIGGGADGLQTPG